MTEAVSEAREVEISSIEIKYSNPAHARVHAPQ